MLQLGFEHKSTRIVEDKLSGSQTQCFDLEGTGIDMYRPA